VRLEGLGSTEESYGLIGNLTRHISACTVVLSDGRLFENLALIKISSLMERNVN
jgi:hypothetical protein